MLDTLEHIGYEKPSPVQAGVIPLVLDDFDVIGQARTGTGKTAAFAIPILEMLDLGVKKAKPQALILAPTRELAVQVENEFKRMSNPEEVRCCCLYGGRPIKQQITQLERGCHVVVGTPGRVIDHLNRGGRSRQDAGHWFPPRHRKNSPPLPKRATDVASERDVAVRNFAIGQTIHVSP